MSTVKVHGQLRCGTNYLTHVLRENFDVTVYESDEGGWKHGPMAGDPETAYVVLTKDPYSWLVSFRSWEEIHDRTKPKPMAAFVQARVSHPRLRETWDASDPIDAWNKSYRSWIASAEKLDAPVVAYEQLLTDFDATMTALGRHIEASPRHEQLVNTRERVDTWATPRKRRPLDLDGYVDRAALADFDGEALALVRERIDVELVEQLGYRVA
jgi:hypothetical protein